MHIIHIIPSISPQSGGPSYALSQFANLAAQWAKVTILTTNEGWKRQSPEEIAEYWGLNESITLKAFPYRGRHSWKSSPKLIKELKQCSPSDIIHIHACFSWISTKAARWAMKQPNPYIRRPLGTLSPYSMHVGFSFLKHWYWRFIERKTLNNCDVIHCTSEQEKRDVAELISKYDHIEVVPIPVEGQTGGITKKLSLSSLVLGYLGRIHPKKNLSLLLKSISELPSKSTLKIQLEIAGEGEKEYVKQLKQQAITHGIQENINWLGFLSGKRKEDFFDRIHYYILPSHHENFGIAVAEALAHGVPVLISDNVDLADEVLSYKAGWVINLKQDDLTEKLTQLIQIDPAKYSQRVQQAYKLYQEMLTPEQINHRLKSIYERCLGS